MLNLSRFRVGLRDQGRAVGSLGTEGEGPAAVIGAAIVAQLEQDGVGAGAQLHGVAAGAKGVVVAEVEVVIVYVAAIRASSQARWQGGGCVGGRVEDAAREGGADVGFAYAAAPGLEQVVEVDEAVVGGAAQPASRIQTAFPGTVGQPGRLLAVQPVIACASGSKAVSGGSVVAMAWPS